MESANGLQFNHYPLSHCSLLHGFAHLTVHIILKLHSRTAVTGRGLNLGGGGGYILLDYWFKGRGGGITSVTFCISNDAICLPNLIAIGAGVVAQVRHSTEHAFHPSPQGWGCQLGLQDP